MHFISVSKNGGYYDCEIIANYRWKKRDEKFFVKSLVKKFTWLNSKMTLYVSTIVEKKYKKSKTNCKTLLPMWIKF